MIEANRSVAAGNGRGKAARLDYILGVAHEKGFASVDELAESLDVSRMTIHRDLDELQQKGLVRKVRGGASTAPSTQFEADLDYRRRMHLPEKRAIARAAINLIEDGDVVLLDDSTTVLELVPLFDRFEQLTVITFSQEVIDQVRNSEHINLISLGGQFMPRYGSFLGVITEENISRLAADVMFLSTSSLYGTTLYHQEPAQLIVRKELLNAANRRVLMVDNSKIGHRALYRLCEVSTFTHVVVDANVPESTVQMLGERGPEVIVAEPVGS